MASDWSTASCSGGSFNHRTKEAAESICTPFWDPHCKTTAVSNKQLVYVGDSESEISGLEDELQIKQESRRRRGISQSQEAPDLPNLLHFLLCSLRVARRRRRRRRLTSDNPLLTDRPTITHILTRPARPGGPTQTSHPGGLPSPHQSGLQGGPGRR